MNALSYSLKDIYRKEFSSDSLRIRFDSKYVIDPDTLCWNWIGSRLVAGYGLFRISQGNYQVAHRVSWFLTGYNIPIDLILLHKCDNPPCVNPAHLRVGTYYDNTQDMFRKGRNVPPFSRTKFI